MSLVGMVVMTSLGSGIPRAEQAARDQLETTGLLVRPATLADNIDFFAGREVTVLNARVVGVFEPHAFLIESATRLRESVGHRDRVLVLIDGAVLTVAPEVVVASTVRVLGVARTLLGMKVSPDVPWPRQLDPERLERLDIRGAVLATSVQTPEGIELTDRRSPPPPSRVPRQEH